MAKRQLSRADRWNAAVRTARAALDEVSAPLDELSQAFNDLSELKDEYESWLDNLPENLRDGPTGLKLQGIVEMDFEVEVDMSEVEQVIDTAESADLPLGWGKD